MDKKYYKVSEVAEIFGMSAKQVRGHCHGSGTLFALQAVRNGNILIDIKKFENYLKGNVPEKRRRIK